LSFPGCALPEIIPKSTDKRGLTDGKKTFQALKVVEYGEDISALIAPDCSPVWAPK